MGGPRVSLDELWLMTDRQLWDIWVQPAIDEAEAERRKKRHQREEREADAWMSIDGVDAPSSDEHTTPTPKTHRSSDTVVDDADLAPHGTHSTFFEVRDKDSRGGRFKWKIPKTSKKKAECAVNGIPISGEAMLDNLMRGGLLKPADVERVKREKAEALAAKAAKEQTGDGHKQPG